MTSGAIVSHSVDQGVVYRVAAAYRRLGVPVRLLTAVYFRPDRFPYRLTRFMPRQIRAPIENWFRRRRFAELDDQDVVSFDLVVLEALSILFGDFRVRNDVYDRCAARWIRRHIGVPAPMLLHGFIETALHSLRVAKAAGMRTVLEITAPPTSDRIVAEEYRREGRPAGRDRLPPRQMEELRIADFIVAQSPFVVDELRRLGVAPERIYLIPLGADVERFHPASRRVDDGIFRVLFVGMVNLRKGLHHLLRAWARLSLDNAELIVAGPLVDKFVLDEMRKTPRTRWIGKAPPDKVPDLYRQADIFVCPSLWEGGPIVVPEALATGLPVIASVGARSVVRDGIDGFVVAVGDIDGLGAAIRKLHDAPDLRMRMGLNARQRAMQFDPSSRARRIGVMYRRILGVPPEVMASAGIEAGASLVGDCIDLTDR